MPVTFHEITSRHMPEPVPYAVLAPKVEGVLPLCLFLLGAGGTREALVELEPVFDALPPMILCTPTPRNDYYIEDPGAARWDSFFADDLLPHLRASWKTSGTTWVCGISGGGYGALKLAFRRPDLFAAVAAMQPMLEPGLRADEAGPRNHLHHVAGGPPRLIGPQRDPVLWEANNPANLARDHVRQLRESGIAVYLDAADRDFLNAHDGAEYLHRLLWELDVPHEYHLVRDADHGGPTLRPRMRAMFNWLGSLSGPTPVDEAAEQAASAWLASGMQGDRPAGATSTNAFIRFLRARFEPLRAEAARRDPNTNRRLGRI